MRFADFTREPSAGSDFAAFRAHYERFWSSPCGAQAEVAPEKLHSRLESLQGQLSQTELALEALGIPTSGVSALAFVGHSASNGHACLLFGRFAAWYALEHFLTPSDFEAFVPHELAHAVHYALVPEFYFTSIEEQRRTGRQLVTEGLATRVAQEVGSLPPEVALWGGFLGADPAQCWISRCKTHLRELIQLILDSWTEPLPGNPLFTYNPALGVEENRGGYFVGMAATAHLEEDQKLPLAELIRLPRSEAERAYQEALLEMLAA